MWYSNLKKKTFISWHILRQHWYTCPITLLVCRNPQYRSLLAVVSATSVPSFQPLCQTFQGGNFLTQLWTALHDKHLDHKQETFLYENPLHWVLLSTHKKKHITEYCFVVIHSSSTVAILTTETILWSCAYAFCYLDCHETGLCCYLLIDIENLLHLLQLFPSICDLFTDSPSYYGGVGTNHTGLANATQRPGKQQLLGNNLATAG
jgi:hypothetical protein